LGKKLDYSFMKNYLLVLASRIMSEKNYLDSLDAACGDGDFGIGMYLGFRNVQRAVEAQEDDDIGALLSGAGSAILSSVGGASGPLFGTFFSEMGEVARGKSEIGLGDLAVMVEASLEKICTRGGAKVGDKTLVDALEPAARSLREAASRETEILFALKAAAEASKSGCEFAANLVAKHGKARYLGEQAVGHVDPGAYVVQVIFDAFLRAYKSSNPSS
jgi:dihydroxyacetone kinase-like protein